MRLFNETQRKQIEKAIQEAESKTSGEIVVMSVPTSSRYRWTHALWAILGWIVASTVVYFVEDDLLVGEVLQWQSLSMFAAALLSWIPWVQRVTIPGKLAKSKVHREALANFIAAGLHRTHHRTGILIYLSELERRVQILADKGIHDEVDEQYWQSQVDRIVQGIRSKKATEAVIATVQELGNRLHAHFPRAAGETSEIPDSVRTKPVE